jgi:GT2 family glycosyltransferase
MRRIKKKAIHLKNKSGLQTNVNKRIERYKQGLEEGYQQGLDAGYKSFESHFEGTSIIIPSYNEVENVKKCIESIINYTNSFYEIIVVDNNSSDGIEQYLKQQGGMVSYHILSHNHGFAGAANRGLMMAKGTTMLLLSNKVVCTDNWLVNMLISLQSNPGIGMVGAVSNGMNGDQRMETSYSDMEDMQVFATMNNISDPSRWGPAENLSKKCLLFRRELLEKVGFLDEGCLEGPYDENDYCIRVRLQGLSLVYAGDAFVHLISRDEEISSSEAQAAKEEAQLYYMGKWINPNKVLSDISNNNLLSQTDVSQSKKLHERRFGETAFYPQAIAVKGLTETIYWIEDCARRPIKGKWEGPVIQLSQIALRQWTIGPVLNEEEALLKLDLVRGGRENAIHHGSICVKTNGDFYYMENGMKREIVSPLAVEAWHMNMRPKVSLSVSDLLVIPDGLPIIVPINLRQAL